MDITVAVVKTYLELHGYFVLTELPVRAPDSHGYHDVTDLDIIAVRFPHPTPARWDANSSAIEVYLGADPRLASFEHGVDLIVGEVKAGAAGLNPALRRAETVAFALRRVGCCPEANIQAEAQRIARSGSQEFAMAGGLRCRARLVAFAGYGAIDENGVLTVPLQHALNAIVNRLRDASEVLAGVQHRDPVLALLALQHRTASSSQAEAKDRAKFNSRVDDRRLAGRPMHRLR